VAPVSCLRNSSVLSVSFLLFGSFGATKYPRSSFAGSLRLDNPAWIAALETSIGTFLVRSCFVFITYFSLASSTISTDLFMAVHKRDEEEVMRRGL
jgi:hypothetical protein